MPDSVAAGKLARALIQTSHIPLLLFDGQPKLIGASDSFFSTFRLRRDHTIGQTLAEMGSGEWTIPQLGLLIENAFLGGAEIGDYETDLAHPDGTEHRLVVSVQSVVDGDAQDARILMMINDVTQVRHVEYLNVALLLEKDKLLEERGVLLQEMQHRVANSLQIIASVLLLKARAVSSEESRSHLQDAHDRVMSIAAVQDHLQPSSGEVDVQPYLTKLCGSLASSMMRGGRGLTLHVDSDSAMISSQHATSLGLIVTELVINCLKHAFPGDLKGRVEVVYRRTTLGWTMSVRDDGVGMPPPEAVKKVGLGTSIVEALAQQLEATVVTSDAEPGTRVELTHTSKSADSKVRDKAPVAVPA